MMRDVRIKRKVTRGDLLGIAKTRLYSPMHAPGLSKVRQSTLMTSSLCYDDQVHLSKSLPVTRQQPIEGEER